MVDQTEVAAWNKAYRQASTELAAVSDGVSITQVDLSSSGDLVVFFHRPGAHQRAWVYLAKDLPKAGGEPQWRTEFARLSLLGDLVPPSHSVPRPAREDLAIWADQFPDVNWSGAVH